MATRYQDLLCEDDTRRARLRASTLNGIDYIEVDTDPPDRNQRVLRVYFVPKASGPSPPPAPQEYQDALDSMLDTLDGDLDSIVILGGVRVRDVEITDVVRVDDHLEVHVDGPGDFSTYRLEIEHALLDPAYNAVEFNFKAGCPSRFDCKPEAECPPEESPAAPAIDYMAKDYASFRQALIDFVPRLVPDWSDRHEADLGMALVELFAYAADLLSYYQDAVANEAYLETARQRVSVRRHARLIDYQLHDGASARAFLHFKVSGDGTVPPGTQVLSRIDVPLENPTVDPPTFQVPPHAATIPTALGTPALDAAGVVFETMGRLPVADGDPIPNLENVPVNDDLNELHLYAWQRSQCCLPRGATTAALIGDWEYREGEHGPEVANPQLWRLKRGDFLLFEEVLGPEGGLPHEADSAHRQVVRLRKAEKTTDPLTGTLLTRVSWDAEDALTFPLCISSRTEGGVPIADVSVVRGNIVLADHGRTFKDFSPVVPEQLLAEPYRFCLPRGPLSYRIPSKSTSHWVSASALLGTDPTATIPAINIEMLDPDGARTEWTVERTLLESDSFDTNFVVETDNTGRPWVRFGQDGYGMAAPAGVRFEATYRIGVGREGNVGGDRLVHILQRTGLPTILEVRNPLGAWGGTDPEPIERVKQLAPAAIHAGLHRAVTEDDYAKVAGQAPGVARAVATFRWTGSWYTVFVAIDPKGKTGVFEDLGRETKAWIQRFAQTGYDIEIDSPQYVPLDIEVDVCVRPDHFREHVEKALLDALSDSTLPDGRRGFFHPDNFSFGEPLYLSRLYAAIESVEGVDSAVVTRFQRFGKAPIGELEQGVIAVDRGEIIELADDPNFQERGVLRLVMRGGK